METAMFFSETPTIKGNDVKRLLKAMESPVPLSKTQIKEIFADAEKFDSRRYKRKLNDY